MDAQRGSGQPWGAAWAWSKAAAWDATAKVGGLLHNVVGGNASKALVAASEHGSRTLARASTKVSEHGSLMLSSIQNPEGSHKALFGTIFWFGVTAGLVLARSRVRAQLHEPGTQEEPGSAAVLDGAEKRSAEGGAMMNLRTGDAVDQEVEAATGRLGRAFEGLVTSCCIYVGDAAGLFKELSQSGPVRVEKLAERTGLHARWLREWMCQMAAAGVLAFDGQNETFELREAYARTLLEPWEARGTASMVGLFQFAPALATRIASLVETLETGMGESYDGSHKQDIQRAIRTMHYNFAKRILCENVLCDPHLGGHAFVERLKQGDFFVAEVGCGAGLALCEMARCFPKSTFDGYELSKEAIQQASAEIQRQRLTNVRMWDVTVNPMGHAAYDFVMCYDVIHDCTDPVAVMRDVARCIKPDGVFLVVDIECFEDLERNISHPAAEARFGVSCGLCLHSGMSAPEAAGLGTLGLNPAVMRKLASQAGFSRCESFSIPALPGNSCFVLRR